MTDNKIIKAWEKIMSTGDAPVGEHWQIGITTKFAKETSDMLNRLKAENERLKDYNENLQTANVALSNEILEAKSEAYKEVAGRLKK